MQQGEGESAVVSDDAAATPMSAGSAICGLHAAEGRDRDDSAGKSKREAFSVSSDQFIAKLRYFTPHPFLILTFRSCVAAYSAR